MSIFDRISETVGRLLRRRPVDAVMPVYRYHPDPLSTKAILATDLLCACCGYARGYRVAGHYGRTQFDCICPWCVADGRAARRLGASFVQDSDTALPPAVWDELSRRTPGYESWQGELWLSHCGDACAFLGDLPAEEAAHLPEQVEALFLKENDWLDDWGALKAAYADGKSDVALYKFACLHCDTVRLGIDFT